MNRIEVLKLLTFAAAIDKRTVGETDVEVWHFILEPLDYARAHAAVVAHFRAKPDVYLAPGHVWAGARTTTDGEHDETQARRVALEAGLAESCEQGTWCQRCDAVHHPHEDCAVLTRRPADHARVIDMFRPRAVTAAPAARPQRRPDDVPPTLTDAAALEAERRRQLDALDALTKEPTA